MIRYYGTAVLGTPGHDAPANPSWDRTPRAPVVVAEWCDEAGCPCAECAACKAR